MEVFPHVLPLSSDVSFLVLPSGISRNVISNRLFCEAHRQAFILPVSFPVLYHYAMLSVMI